MKQDTIENGEGHRKEPHLELSFEYLIAKDKLQWISIFSEQAILMSVSLQSMVDELLLKKAGARIKQVCSKHTRNSYSSNEKTYII